MTFDSEQFHDSTLLQIDWSKWTERVSVLLYCPNASSGRNLGKFLWIHFDRVLLFSMEVGGIGELGKHVPLAGIVMLDDSPELSKWNQNIKRLARPSEWYPRGVRSTRYDTLYHFVIESVEFQALAIDGTAPCQIVCRDFTVQPAGDDAIQRYGRFSSGAIEADNSE